MKNSLRMIGIFVILWFGLGIGLANAMTAPTNTASLQAPGPINNFAADAEKIRTFQRIKHTPCCSVA